MTVRPLLFLNYEPLMMVGGRKMALVDPSLFYDPTLHKCDGNMTVYYSSAIKLHFFRAKTI